MIESPNAPSSALLQKIYDSLPVLVMVLDIAEWRIRYLNRPMEAMLGYEPQDLAVKASQRPRKLIHPDDEHIKERLQRQLLADADGRIYICEMRWRHKSGEWRWFRQRACVLERDLDGLPITAIVAARDITDDKLEEAAAREFERSAFIHSKDRELEELKNQMMTRISHEFRTPLAIIQSSAELMTRYHDRLDDVKRAEHVHRIYDAIQRITGMIDSITFVVEGDLDKLMMVATPFDLARVAEAVLERFRGGAGANHHLILEIGTLPAQVMMDKDMLDVILNNLLSNAILYSQPGTTVRLHLAAQDNILVMQVIDQGHGILPEDEDRIFEPFFRGRNISEVHGLGLGLTIVRNAVERLHGTVGFYSDPNVGTIFTVRLPLGTHDA